MTTYFCTYTLHKDQNTRDQCMTLYGGMTPEDVAKELGSVRLLGRWSTVGQGKGYCIAEADTGADVARWLTQWIPMADISVVPVLDDNQQRSMILKQDPPYLVSYDKVGDGPVDGETLYMIKYQFKPGTRTEGFKIFANLTKEQDESDSGLCTPYGRYHIPSQGSGMCICSAPNASAIYQWAYNWNEMCDVYVEPVTSEEMTRKIIQSQPGFSHKHAALMEKIASSMPPVPSGPCFVTATFTFKTDEGKQEFIDILNGDDGLSVTRSWPGNESISCFSSTENPLKFVVQQKWASAGAHAEYMAMRKSTGLFDHVTSLLSEPLDIVHLESVEV